MAAAPPEKAAEALADLALSPEFQDLTGAFYTFQRRTDSNVYSNDQAVQERLWQASLVLAGYFPP